MTLLLTLTATQTWLTRGKIPLAQSLGGSWETQHIGLLPTVYSLKQWMLMVMPIMGMLHLHLTLWAHFHGTKNST